MILILFQKRLFKRISFWLLLCAVPLLAWGMKCLSFGESGMLHILLCLENPADALSGEVAGQLYTGKSVIQFTLVQQPEEARALVEAGEADGAWIFPDGMQERLDRFIGGGADAEGVVCVVEREDNVALRLAREKLFGVLYPHASYALYRDFILKDLGLETGEARLRQSHEDTAVEGSLFQSAYADGSAGTSQTMGQDYLTMPVRGMMAILLLLCGMAADLYFLRDQEKGVLDRVPLGRRRKFLYLHQLTVMGTVAVAVLAALGFSGVFLEWHREILCMAVYIVMCMGFCSLLQRLCGKLHRLAALIPCLLPVCFVLCPVFFSVRQWRILQNLLPPFYYLNAVHNASYLYKMLLYCFLLVGVDLVLDKCEKHFPFPFIEYDK